MRRAWRSIAIEAAALAGAALGLAAHAGEDGLVLPAPGGPEWRDLEFPSVDAPTRYRAVEVEGEPAVEAESRCAASARAVAVPGLALAKTPVLVWRWRVDSPEASADHDQRSGDDFPARVYVSFRFEPERASRWERLRRRAAEVVYGAELPGNALSYVWCAHRAPGTSWDNPYTADSKMISVGASPPGVWRELRVDVLADYRRSFGREPPEVAFVALMSDSDDQCAEARAAYAGLRFEPAMEPGR